MSAAGLTTFNQFKNPFSKTPLKMPKIFHFFFGLSFIATLFDSFASWYSISHSDVALEMNGTWNFFDSLFGFEAAMIIRSLWGLFLLWALWECSRRLKQERARKWSILGLYFVSSSLLALCFYHIFGYMWANGIWPFTW